ADANKGQFQIIDDGDDRTPSGHLPDEDGLFAGFLASDPITHISGGRRGVGRLSGTHSLTPADDAGPGTTVILRQRRGETLLNADRVLALARRYAEALPIPVEVMLPTGAVQMVSQRAPWLTADPVE